MPERQTKKQRIEEAREAARLAREKREKRQKLLKVLVPSIATLVVLGIAALIVVVVIATMPKPAFPGGPKNMASDGILFQGDGTSSEVVNTAALKKGDKPKATEFPANDGLAHIVTYVDWSCPACKSFESAYSEQIDQIVAAGQATLEVHPIAILDHLYSGSRYSSRSANAAACIANFAPEKFAAAQTAMFDAQPESETGPGLSNAEIKKIVNNAGADSDAINTCIDSEQFKKWVTAATQRATSDADLQGSNGFSTPTVVVNGQRWDPQKQSDFGQFLVSAVSGG
ncbi:thioredoxin domain-containing protein [Schumannella sp. 10F1B-5-1]|uniref:DsbA family protein n=1 Tax=Schumannella sp. 10F1B-5-1 TaxID=2590780 RepID=UPI0011310D36|nr:thioredoxin domain-containing protein [Schumannella sp. 10F1B-5-1]TPW70157.1 hypothetical protein FJ658_14130 [Schumannella sp. 10F1B-5-1]